MEAAPPLGSGIATNPIVAQRTALQQTLDVLGSGWTGPVTRREHLSATAAKNWTEAQRYCRENFIDLATVADVNDMWLLYSLVDLRQMFASSYTYEAWIGLYSDFNSWRWSMSDPNFYQQNESFRNWYPSQPDNNGGDAACAVFSGSYSGAWTDASCALNLPSVCMDVSGRNATFYLISTTMTWFQAQSYCRQYHTDLASVRNLSENQRLMTLVQSSGAWFGLYRNNWRWSDDSTMSYTSWNKKYPAGGIRGCVAAGFKGPGGWEDWMCDAEKVFVCYSGPSRRAVKLKLVRDSSLNLSDPVVLEDMLGQLKLKLKGQGVNNVQLRWREKPNGQVFSKDEEKNPSKEVKPKHDCS
ncbi:putative C-type lectin domain family 20 member A isoform X1 [Nothobranchius furzeri]|uniref:putative C-type lectin domain family 20 member A isoform X1 n=1 Tax=Nothobranchius furzeri TaxID=105023 RepID=UPI003904CE57